MITLHRGDILHVPDPQNPTLTRSLEDGALAVDGTGSIVSTRPFSTLRAVYPDAEVVDHRPGLIIPGLIDAHVHYPQYLSAGAHGETLLDWLNTTTFPEELRFAEAGYAAEVAEAFVRQLLRQGTTSAFVFGVRFEAATATLIDSLSRVGMRARTGMVWMDRNGPAELCVSADAASAASERLADRCAAGPVGYALLPRFAPACTPGQLAAAGELFAAHPEWALQTHLAESRSECDWVSELFPAAPDYTAVYEAAGCFGAGASFAHGIHLSDDERRRLAAAGSTLVHCPSANNFLGSGLFEARRTLDAGLSFALGSDVGAGTSLCLLDTLRDAYGVAQLVGAPLSVGELLHAATSAGADALGISDHVGNFNPGKEANFIVLNPRPETHLAARWTACDNLEDRFFSAALLGGAEAISRTFLAGTAVSCRAGDEGEAGDDGDS
jgi:guanine deaminase